MSFPTSRDRREKPEANIAHVRPMVIKEPVSMASQWPLSSSGHMSRMDSHMTPPMTATGLSSAFPFISRPRDVSAFHQASVMNALPPFHLLPGNDVFHAGLATSYPHYATSLSREELLHRDVMGPCPPFLHSQAPYVVNNSLLHHVPFHPMAYPYGFVKDNSNLEPYRPLVLSKPNTPEKPSKLEKQPMSQINDALFVHPHSPLAKRKCHLHEKIWDHKNPPDKKEAYLFQSTKAKQNHHRDGKCVLRVPEIKAQHSAFTHTKRHEESHQSLGEVLDLSLKRKVFPHDGKDIPPDKKKSGRDPAVQSAPVKVTPLVSPGRWGGSANHRMDSVIRMAPRLDRERRDEGLHIDNYRISHSVPINNAAHKHSVYGNHLDKANQQVVLSNNSLTSSKLDYENAEKKRRRKQNKPQYHKQENEAMTEIDVISVPNDICPENKFQACFLETQKNFDKHKMPHMKKTEEPHKNNKHKMESVDFKSNEVLRGDCHQVLLAKHVLNIVGLAGQVSLGENVTFSSEIENSVMSDMSVKPKKEENKETNEMNKPVIQCGEVQTPNKPAKKKCRTNMKDLKSFNIKEILVKSHNGLKQSVDGPKKRGRKPNNDQGHKRVKGKKAEERSGDKSNAEAANCQPLKLETNEIASKEPTVNETCNSEQCTEPSQPPPQPLAPPKRKRGRPRKSESLAALAALAALAGSNGAGSIGKESEVKTSKTETETNATKKGRRGPKKGAKKVQTAFDKKVHTSRGKPGMAQQKKNCKQMKLQGPISPKQCAVLLCKLQMGGRQSVNLNEIASFSQCAAAEEESNKHIMMNKSDGLSLEKTGEWDGKESMSGSRDLVGSEGETGEQLKHDERGPRRRKKRSCGYPYSPLLFAIGHCPLPHCVACKGHTASKTQVKRRKRVCKPGKEKQMAEDGASGDHAKVPSSGLGENVGQGDQLSSDVAVDGPVITPSAPNITCIKEIDPWDIKHPGYNPNTHANDAHSMGLSNNSGDKSNINCLDNSLINIPGSTQQNSRIVENSGDVLSKKNHPGESIVGSGQSMVGGVVADVSGGVDDDNNSVMSDQTELCEEEVVDIEGVESLSPVLCGEQAAKVEGNVDSSVQLENQWQPENASLSYEQEGQQNCQQNFQQNFQKDTLKDSREKDHQEIWRVKETNVVHNSYSDSGDAYGVYCEEFTVKKRNTYFCKKSGPQGSRLSTKLSQMDITNDTNGKRTSSTTNVITETNETNCMNVNMNGHDINDVKGRVKCHTKVYVGQIDDINRGYDLDSMNINVDMGNKPEIGDCSLLRKNDTRQIYTLESNVEQDLKVENYDAQEAVPFMEEDRQIVAYKGIVTVDETENADMYPSGLYVSSVV